MSQKKIFLIDENVKIFYEDFLSSLKKNPYYRTYCKVNSLRDCFEQIVLAIIANAELTLLDSDLSDVEIERLLPEDADINLSNKVSDIPNDCEGLMNALQNAKNFSLTLFTSGTTGLPKKVIHTLDTLSRFVKTGERHTNDIWGFAYNPTHIAGIQVLMQALLNQNTIVRLFCLKRDDILKNIKEAKISHISATPTFYRMLLPATESIESVKRITSGGERFDPKTIEALSKMFPSAQITNVYASTEAGTLFASKGDTFILKENMVKFVKIENGELFIHKSLLGESEAKKNVNSDWYNTGDLVEIVAQNPLQFKFISRKSSMINTGGYKVNPEEVEEAIRAIDGVRQVRVFGKKNSILGNIVCAEIEKSAEQLDEKIIRTKLGETLQEFKIPRIIKFVEDIAQTRTGKIERKQ